MKLSIIISSSNQAESINKTIGALLNQAKEEPYEIIVVDCGTVSNLVETIHYPQVITVVNPRLADKRCCSRKMGAKLAQGNVLLFLDPDTMVPFQYDVAIHKALQKSSVVGGAFGFSFDRFSYSLYCISLFNRLGYRFRKSFNEDQGIFVRRRIYEKAGGWPQHSKLEAACFCKSLRKYGELKLLPQQLIISSRRYTETGSWRILLNDCKIWGMDLLGMNVEKQPAVYLRGNNAPHPQSKKVSEEISE